MTEKKANMEDLSEHLDPLTADSSQFKAGQWSSYANPELSGIISNWKKAPIVLSRLHCWSPDLELPIKLVVRRGDFAPFQQVK